MFNNLLLKKSIAFVLIISLVALPTMTMAQDQTQTQTQMPEYLQGKEDGKTDGKGSAGWMFAGFLCGLFGFIAAAASNPSPPAEKLIGKSSEYVLGYTEGYKSSAKNKNITYACGGWVVGAVVGLLILSSQDNGDL